MSVTLGELIYTCRNLISEPSPVRFTQAMLADYASNAQFQLAMDVDHPEGTHKINIINNQREYQLPELVKILRVYILGPDGSMQPLIGSDLPTLEGEIQETFDNTSSTQVGAPQQTPQWIVQPPMSYPVTNVPIGGRVPTKSTWGHNNRPSYYLRGGYIGLSVPPMSTSPQTVIQVDYIPSPPKLITPSQSSLFPELAKMALVWKMIEYCRYSDNSSETPYAAQMYAAELEKVRNWVYTLQANRPKGFIPVTKRGQRSYGRRRW